MAVQPRALSRDDRLVEQKRKIIIEAALKVFSQKSYAGATVEEIAQMAGMTIGNVYRYIGSKQEYPAPDLPRSKRKHQGYPRHSYQPALWERHPGIETDHTGLCERYRGSWGEDYLL